ncbi:serine/arginine repetitive matrix protein 1-like isoform X2 [Daktulosphaira vitifoliae]|uniref:serine/arginine repetitive matrix protein 1-like isoform X2 n=1 Tax=Daktulosphaira vitifoliae TaxID=58002 RepID=UPI0021AAD160|nr:serine/arginine repetitive matrix protein 1-like isoform X2 [Daktulosphaira vitifoliae]
MDYNKIDDDDVESLRLAALMSCKRKPTNLINTISSTSGDIGQNKFGNNSSYSNYGNRNTRGRFPPSNRSFKRTYANVGFKRPTHSNNNLISIIPIDSEGDQLSENSKSQIEVNNKASSKDSLSINSGDKINNENIEVSTKFSRLENDSGSEESTDESDADKEEKVDSDDGDVLLLGQEDEDLDDLDKLMDIMEAEIAGKDIKQKKEKKNLKQCNKVKKDKPSVSKIKVKNIKCESQPNFKDDLKILPKQTEELESIKTVEEVRNSSSFSGLPKLHIHPRTPSPIRKRSISPYRQLRKRSLTPRSPRRRSPTPDRYRYSPIRSRTFRRSLTPRRSPRRISPLREKNLSPRRYTPPKSRYPYRSPSPRRRRRSISRDISPGRRRLSPIRRRSRSPLRSKSRSPKCRIPIRRRSPSPLKKIRCASPLLRRKDTKILDDNNITVKEKPKSIDKEIDNKILDPVLEARKRKFESNKPIELTSKKIILKKSNSVQVAIQTDNEDEIETDVSNKISLTSKRAKLSPHLNQNVKNCIKTKNNTKSVDKIVKLITQSEKTNKKRPRIMFGQEIAADQQIEEKDILELSSTSEELMEEEKDEEVVSEENDYDEESEKEEGQESSESYVDDSEEDIDNHVVHTFVEEKKDSLKCDETVDLRTELKRRRALRLNTVQIKKKSGTFYPARLLQSAIRGVVGTSGSIEVKRKIHGELPEISIKTEGNSDGRRVVVVNRDKNRSEVDVNLLEKNLEDKEESYESVKKLKGKLKKVPSRLRTIGITENLTIHKGLRKMKKRNISVTDFNQM